MVLLLLLDAVLVDPPLPVAVAPVPPEMVAPGEDVKDDEAAVDDAVEADCAVVNENKEHKVTRKKPQICMLTGMQ